MLFQFRNKPPFKIDKLAKKQELKEKEISRNLRAEKKGNLLKYSVISVKGKTRYAQL